MKRIKRARLLHLIWLPLLLVTLVSGLFVVRTRNASAATQAATPLNATIYVATSTLKPLFQSHIDALVPTAFNGAIAGIVNKMPAADRALIGQMASALLQPSASLTSLTPQQAGLAASLVLSLYTGDPKPTNADMLFQFKVLDSSTAQVSASALNGSPALVSGPVATLKLPFGQLNSIVATPSCGDSGLSANLQIPVSLGTGSGQAQQGQTGGQQVPLSSKVTSAASPVSAYVEIPNASLASLGGSVGTIQIDSTFSARNVRFSISGGQIVITSEIYFNNFIDVGTATSYVQPQASNGNLAVKVVKTTLTLLGIFTVPMDSYNQQIQQTLNSKLNGALAGKFNVTAAGIGPLSNLPCVAGDSLLLTGTTNLG